MNFIRSIFFVVVLCVSSGAVATAQDFDRGLAAYEAGDFASALEIWRPMAEGTIGSGGSSLADRIARSLNDMPDSNASYARMRAANHIGIMHQFGQGVLQDDVEAVRWFRIAAERGHASAQYNLGLMFSNSQSTVQDNVRAHMWYNISVANGGDLGGERRDKIVEEMTPADVSKAQAMARECMSSGYEDCGWGWRWW